MKKNNRVVLAILSTCILTLASCGGGSSGTGENVSLGVVVNAKCQPVPNVDMNEAGVETEEGTTGSDGSFTVPPSVGESIEVPTSSPETTREAELDSNSTTVDVSDPTCIVISYVNNEISAVLSYPLEEVESCTIEAVNQKHPSDVASICTENSAAPQTPDKNPTPSGANPSDPAPN